MRNAAPFLVCVALLAGCSGRAQAPSSLPLTPSDSVLRNASPAVAYRSIFDFNGGSNGLAPEAGLVELGGKFYGTTFFGGSANLGTVFEISKSGKERVLHSFQGGSDGQNPSAALVAVHGVLYGTTVQGGAGPSGGNGTVFSITPDGVERVLYAFQGGNDGARSYGSLIEYKGLLYGTTVYGGGPTDSGTVFSIDTSGNEKVVYRFQDDPDGSAPLAGLIRIGGTFYGTTLGGGSGNGTVYALTPAGQERVVYTFKGGKDGETPSDLLLDVGGTLYGTTAYGGSSDPSISNGVVFSVTLDGQESVLYRFQGGTDGASPSGGLTELNGDLYGVTYFGGDGNQGFAGNGTIYQVTPSGKETVLHAFAGSADGGNPYGELIVVKGSLYGTSSQQGLSQRSGNGNVYVLTP